MEILKYIILVIYVIVCFALIALAAVQNSENKVLQEQLQVLLLITFMNKTKEEQKKVD